MGDLAGGAVVHGHRGRLDLDDRARFVSQEHVGGVPGGGRLHAGPDVGRLGAYERDGLALHVGPHQGPVGVVVFDEGYEGSGHGDDLFWRNVHQLHFFGWYVGDLRGCAKEDVLFELEAEILKGRGLGRSANQYPGVLESTVRVEGRVGLGDDVLLLRVGGHVTDLVGDPAIFHNPVGGLDEAEIVDPPVGG